MKLIVDHIKEVPHSIHVDESADVFPLLAGIQNDVGCRITGNIQGDISAVREYENIRINGRLTAPLVLSCSRCLAEYQSFVDTSFTIFFRKGEMSAAQDNDELELGEMDLLSSTYSGDEIDLTNEIAEQIVMEIPLKPLCSDNCKGLCHVCGIDLNTSRCSCSKEPVSLTFSALKDFKVTTK